MISLALAASACGGSGSAGSTATPPQAAPSDSGPHRLDSVAMPAGDYTTTRFRPTLTFTVGDESWRSFFPDDEDEISLGAAHGEVQITRVTMVVDPETNEAIHAPPNLARWLTRNPALDASSPVDVTVAGLHGTMVEADVRREQDLFAYPTGNFHTVAGTHARYYVLELEGPDLTIVVDGPKDEFAAHLPVVEAMLDTLVVHST